MRQPPLAADAGRRCQSVEVRESARAHHQLCWGADSMSLDFFARPGPRRFRHLDSENRLGNRSLGPGWRAFLNQRPAGPSESPI